MALTQISTQGIKDGTITGTDLATNVDLVDDQKLRLGNSQDLQIFHDGSHSYIKDTGTGRLILQSSQLCLQSTTGENFLVGNPDAGTELYHNNSKKFETTSAGVSVTGEVSTTGHIRVPDNMALIAGTGSDLFIYHDSANSLIDEVGTGILGLRSNTGINLYKLTGNEFMLKAIPDGAVELYYDNSKKFATTSNGNEVFGNLVVGSVTLDGGGLSLSDSDKVKCGNGDDLQIYHTTTGNSSYILNSTGDLYIASNNEVRIKGGDDAAEYMGRFIDNGAVELYYDGSKKFETTSAGVTVTGKTTLTDDLSGGDNVVLRLGNATGGDLSIFHDGTHSKLVNSTGDLHLASNNAVKILGGSDLAEVQAVFNDNGGCELFYDNSKKFETSSEGVKFTLSGNATNRFDQTSTSNNKFQNLTYSRSASGRGDCSVIAIGEGTSSQGHIKIRTSGGNAGLSGGVELNNGNTAFAAISDIRLKNKISDITDALTNIDKIEPIKYSWKYDKENIPHIGVSAQSVNEVYPEIIELTRSSTDESDETDYLSVLHTELIPVCIAAIKELKAKVKVLETEVAALKAA